MHIIIIANAGPEYRTGLSQKPGYGKNCGFLPAYYIYSHEP
jgi:hypothetical protein